MKENKTDNKEKTIYFLIWMSLLKAWMLCVSCEVQRKEEITNSSPFDGWVVDKAN